MNEQQQLSRESALALARLLDDQKAKNITVLDMNEACSFTSFFLLATATSGPHLRALGNRVLRQAREDGLRPLGKAGFDGDTWIVLDYSDFVVHILSEEARDFYRLEALWADAKKIPLSLAAPPKIMIDK